MTRSSNWLRATGPPALVAVAFATFLTLSACAGKPEAPPETSEAEAVDPAKEAYRETMSAYRETEEAAEKVALLEAFLTEYPDIAQAASAARMLLNQQGDELGEPDAAYETVTGVLEQTTDPERRFSISMALRPTARDIGKPLDLRSVVAGLENERALSYKGVQAGSHRRGKRGGLGVGGPARGRRRG